MTRTRFMLTILLSALLFSACAPDSTTPGASAPTAAPVLSDACGVADQFLKAWEANDYATMYGLTSPKSKQTSQSQFTTSYQNADKQMAAPTKSHTLDFDTAQLQGTTAAITYNMAFDSPALGQFSDPKRTIRLVWSPRGWAVAWSTMDIFEGIAGGAVLSLNYTSATRGTIYDRNDKPIAQDNQLLYSAILSTQAYPKKPDDCFIEIAYLFKRKLTEVTTELKGLTGLQYTIVVGHMDQATYDARHGELDAVCKVNYTQHKTRVYFGNGLAAQTIGYVGDIPADRADKYPGYPAGALVGLDGLEKVYEKQLAGTSGASLTIRLPDGTLLRTIAAQPTKPAQDVKLTIDRDLQAATEQAISDAYNDAAPSWAQFSTGAAAIVMNVHTGEILAIASYPTFDVDVFNPSDDLDRVKLINRISSKQNQYAQAATTNLVTSEYSPLGSVFKIVSMAAAADSGTFKLDQTYTCTGKWYGADFKDSRVFRWDWIGNDPGFADKNNRHGTITLVQALTASCDAYFFQVGGTLNQKDPALLPSYALQLGFGAKTGLPDLPELLGQIPSPDNIGQIASIQGRGWDIGDALNEVIGQGDVKVTPIQVGHMMVAIANGGTLWRPWVVQGVGTSGNSTYTGAPQAQGTINIQPKVLDGIKQGLCGVTMDDNLGTAHWFLRNWDFGRTAFCGKTGTAESTAHPNGWFAAYAGPPGANKPPDIAIAVLVEHGREGSETAGPIVRRIVEAYYHIPYNAWPEFWQEQYLKMPDPTASDGGRH